MTQAGASHGVGRDVGGRKECKEPDCVADSTVSGGGVSVTGGGARDLGRTGGVLSRKDRLQVANEQMFMVIPCSLYTAAAVVLQNCCA